MISTNANQEIPPNLFHDSNPIEAPYSYAEQFSHTGLILQKYLPVQKTLTLRNPNIFLLYFQMFLLLKILLEIFKL